MAIKRSARPDATGDKSGRLCNHRGAGLVSRGPAMHVGLPFFQNYPSPSLGVWRVISENRIGPAIIARRLDAKFLQNRLIPGEDITGEDAAIAQAAEFGEDDEFASAAVESPTNDPRLRRQWRRVIRIAQAAEGIIGKPQKLGGDRRFRLVIENVNFEG